MNIGVRPGEISRIKRIAVVGSGISGLSAAWLLGRRHEVMLFEAEGRLGGHSNTVMVDVGDARIPVDMGFIVYNEATYPNLAALFRYLDVPTKISDMSFSVSLDKGRLEYAGTDLQGLFAQKRNLMRPRFWSMLRDLLRFYREAPHAVDDIGDISLGAYLDRRGYGLAVREDHLYPMAAAIWSIPAAKVMDYPAASFIRFCDNHGLLKISGRPVWRTVEGGSRIYVERLLAGFGGHVRMGSPVRRVRRLPGQVVVEEQGGRSAVFDHVVLACHADQSLALLADASEEEARVLGALRYGVNEAVLHQDEALMPKRQAVWSSWNYLSGEEADSRLCVTYWMNRLQGFRSPRPLFVTLNPATLIDPRKIIHRTVYDHPIFDASAMAAQKRLWDLQGQRGTWFAGAFFGAGFHEDGLQAGLAVAEALGGVKRPWTVDAESGRIHLPVTCQVAEAAA